MPADAIDALVAADPARTLAATDTGQLARRRASVETPDAVGRRRGYRAPRRALLIVGALLSTGAVAGVAAATGIGPWQRDVSRQAPPDTAAAVFAREYAAAQEALVLPADASWPVRTVTANAVIPTGRGGRGESVAVMAALDAWTCEVVRTHGAGDRAAFEGARDALGDLVTHHIVDVPAGTPEDGAAPSALPGPIAQFAPGDVPTQVYYARIIASARAGDVSAMGDLCAQSQ